MVTIETNANGERFIACRIKGGSAEYVEQLRALATALSPAPDDSRQVLSQMLVEMLPTETQLNLEK